MEHIRIRQELLEEGMVIAKDVLSPDGILLVPSGTSVSANHIVKINVHQVGDLFIRVDKPDTEAPIFLEKRMGYVPLDETAAFIEFSFKYDHQVSEVRNQLSHIVQTGDIDSDNLTILVDDILTTTATKSQLFSYMCRLSSTDDITYNHSMNVSLLASIFGKWLHLSNGDIKDLAIAGLLHDIGKIKVDPIILNKKEKLTDAEFDHLKQHPTLGYQIVAKSDLPNSIKQAILMHHEKMNGAGYPLGLSWDRIHDFAKIIAIVDIYDAMTAERPYHKKFHPFEVIKMFEEECYGILDTKYLYVFLEHIAHNFLGDKVELSDHTNGEIIFINKLSPSRPLIQTIDGRIIDLMKILDIRILNFI